MKRHRKFVDVVMVGARMHYAVPRLLFDAGFLAYLYTDSYISNKKWLEAIFKYLPLRYMPRIIQRWSGRTNKVIPADKVISFDILGIWYAWSLSRSKSYEDKLKIYRAMERRFTNAIVQYGLSNAPIVWGFNGGSVSLFEVAKKEKKYCILEQFILPIPLQNRYLIEEGLSWPGWQNDISYLENDSYSVAREAESWSLADSIVVGSEFVSDGLVECGVSKDKIRIIPYGVSTEHFVFKKRSVTSSKSPLKVLFVGEIGLRKGVPYLLEALSELGANKVCAKFAGSIVLEKSKLDAYRNVAEYLGAVPRIDVPELYRWADIFVLPSIVEGSATVTYEALLSGLPVITTPNSGSVVVDGYNGFLVPMRDINSLVKKLDLYYSDRDLLFMHQNNCSNSKYYAGLERYREDLSDLITEISIQDND